MSTKRRAIRSDLARIDKLRDEDIDYSDIRELDDKVFAQPLVTWAPRTRPGASKRSSRKSHQRQTPRLKGGR
jgi:hypothetical protein